jgi:hypothetical protein
LLLVSIFNSSNQWNKFLVAFFVSLIGIAISWVWNHIQSRALLRIEKYEDSIIFIEKRLQIKAELCSFFVQGTNHNEERRKKGTARHVMKQFSKYSMYVWLLSSIIFFALLIIHICCPSINLSNLVVSAEN